jgi:cobalt-zinc-cadmium efflux system membrane fusion protein
MRPNLYITYYLILAFTAISCSKNDRERERTITNSNPDIIQISKEQTKVIGLKFSKLESIHLTSGISVNGYFATPPENTAYISSNVSGKVLRIDYQIGEKVNRGSEVVCVESIEFLEIQRDYISTRSSLKYLKDEYERQKKLAEQNVNARKVYLKAEKDYLESKAQLESLRKKLEILKINTDNLEDDQISSQLSIKSPIQGYISEVNTTTGETIDTEKILIKVVNPVHMHAELNVFEKDILKVKLGQKVELSIPNAPENTLSGEIILIGKEIDEQTRSVKIHVHFPDNENLYVGMYVEGKILMESSDKIAIPEQGLVKEEKRSYVYRLVDETSDSYSLKRELVEVVSEHKGFVAINFMTEIDVNDVFATSGVYYLSSDLGSE